MEIEMDEEEAKTVESQSRRDWVTSECNCLKF